MGTEIERKFLLKDASWKDAVREIHALRQGYFPSASGVTTRIRVADEKAFLTIKGPATNISRPEFEYEIPRIDAEMMLLMFCGGCEVVKHRSILEYEGYRWEIDEFHGENEGLVVAEIELESQDEPFPVPPWLGLEVSYEPRYRNSRLLRHPFSKWSEEERNPEKPE